MMDLKYITTEAEKEEEGGRDIPSAASLPTLPQQPTLVSHGKPWGTPGSWSYYVGPAQAHYQEAGLQMNCPGLQQVLWLWDVGAASSSLQHSAPNASFYLYSFNVFIYLH